MINSISVFQITNPINVIFSIPNVKLADPAVFFSSWIEVSSYCNTFSWQILLDNYVEASELMNNYLNLILLYCRWVDELKI